MGNIDWYNMSSSDIGKKIYVSPAGNPCFANSVTREHMTREQSRIECKILSVMQISVYLGTLANLNIQEDLATMLELLLREKSPEVADIISKTVVVDPDIRSRSIQRGHYCSVKGPEFSVCLTFVTWRTETGLVESVVVGPGNKQYCTSFMVGLDEYDWE